MVTLNMDGVPCDMLHGDDIETCDHSSTPQVVAKAPNTYMLLQDGCHGQLVRRFQGSNGRSFAFVRKQSGSYESGRIVREWRDERAAMRDRFTPEQRKTEVQ